MVAKTSPKKSVSDRSWIGLGHGIFALLLILSVVFFRERTIHFDTACYIFNYVVTEDFYIAWERFISVPYQVIPLLAVKAGASLKTVLILQSMAYVLLPWLAYAIAVHLFKAIRVGLWLALGYIVTQRYAFYAPVAEVVCTLPFVAIFFAWLLRPANLWRHWSGWLQWLVGMVLAIPFTGGHAFMFIIMLLFSGFYILWSRFRPGWLFIWTSAGGLLLLLWGLWPALNQSYGASRVGQLTALGDWLRHPGDYIVTDLLINYWHQHYWLVTILFFAVLVELGRQKRWLVLAYSLLSVVGMVLIVGGLYTYLNFETYLMIDTYLIHAGVAAALPMAFLCTVPIRQQMHLVIMVILSLYCMYGIAKTSKYYTEREDFLLQMIETHTDGENPKAFVAFDANTSFELLWYDWAMPMETLLLTGVAGPKDVRTLEVMDPGRQDWNGWLDNPDYLALPEWYPPDSIMVSDLPPRYFALKPAVYLLPE
ncbi:MAG: hypothetical protein AAGF87_18955 [Bacteroidota bacterium]